MAESNPQQVGEPVELEFYARPEHLSEVRKLVERLAAKTALSRAELDDLLTAVEEAVANAIRHGAPHGERSRVRVVCQVTPHALTVQICDNGPGFAVGGRIVMPGPDATGGRGLPLMCALADTVEISSNSSGTSITLKKLARNYRGG
jgi:anti-sigma regulatory factor (Ser/Thr protein kinase)